MLHDELKNVIQTTLTELYPLWINFPKYDYKRVVRRLESRGQYNFSLEVFAGVRTGYEFFIAYRGLSSAVFLEGEMRRLQPELFSYLIGVNMASLVQDVWSYIPIWLDFLTDKSRENSLDQSIALLISELDHVLKAKAVNARIISPICGLRVASNEVLEDFAFEDDLIMRRMDDLEFEEMMSSDVHDNMSGTSHFMPDISYILEHRATVPVYFSNESCFSESTELKKIYDRNDLLMQAFHLVGVGKVTILKTYHQNKLKVLPFVMGGMSNILLHHSFQLMEISLSDLAEIKKVFDQLKQCNNQQIMLAVSRLMDAEQRMSPVDTLLDSFIGLEALLNSGKMEASYKICLNYSFMGKKETRKERFSLMDKLYNVRSKIVHGDFVLNDVISGDIHENAKLAKLCLREVLMHLLNNTDVYYAPKIQKKFWEGKIFEDSA